jgi:di/tripeptidase
LSRYTHDFNKLVRQIEDMAKAGAEINPEDFYPEIKKYRGKPQNLPMNDRSLRAIFRKPSMQRLRAGVDRASSHIDRRTLLTNIENL